MPQLSVNDVIPKLVATTLPMYIKQAEDETVRNQKLTALLKKKTEFNCKGRFVEWPVIYAKGNTSTRSPGETVNWQPVDRIKNASLPWAQYITPDKYTEEEDDRNAGAAAIIKYYSELPQRVMADLGQDFGVALYNNGNTAGQSNQLYGLETVFGNAGTCISTTPVINPSGTYAGLSTNLYSYGGVAGSIPWPMAQLPPQSDFWSPIILDATSTLQAAAGNYGWQNSVATFASRAEEILSFAVTYSRRNVMGKDGLLSLFILNDQYYQQFKMVNRAKEKIQVDRGQGETLVSMGFTDVINFDGTEVTSEWSVPVATGYGLTIGQMGIKCEKDRMFVPTGPQWDPYSKSWLLDVAFRGQLTMRPRHLVRIGEYGTAG